MNIVFPKEVKRIIEKLNNSGFEGFIVGGCVRDCIMNKTPHDWDICTNAKPDEIESCFADHKTLDVGKKHGTIGVVISGKLYEITTYRIDGEYLDNRRPKSVEFTSDIKNDLSRRDFTINAMAFNEIKGLVDPFGGQQDIADRLIKCVGNATDRFNEDSLRILRGLRFASRFDFEIEKETSTAIHNCKELLNNVAYERIRVELMGIICGKSAEKILNDYRDVIAVIIPEITPCFDFEQKTPHHCLDVYRHIARSVGNIESDPLLRLTMLLHDIGKPNACTTDENGRNHFKGHPKISAEIAAGILKRLRFSNAIITDCLMLIEYHDVRFKGNKKTVKRVAGKIGIDNTKRLLKIQYADTMAQSEYNREQKLNDIKTAQAHINEIIKDSECFSLKQLAVNGYDLKSLGFPDGKLIGDILNDLYEKVIGDELPNDKEILLKYVKEKMS